MLIKTAYCDGATQRMHCAYLKCHEVFILARVTVRRKLDVLGLDNIER